MEAKDILIEKYGYWGEHPDYRVADWGYEAGNNDTRLGYWDWVVDKEEEARGL